MIDINSLRERNNTEVFSVSELNNYIKSIFENNRTLTSVTVRGEISNFVCHKSGHLYFSLKDADAQMRAVMFRSRASTLKFLPDSGMKVIVHGAVTVYPRDGSYQIYVSSIQPDGIGALYLAYEQLKERLLAEGLFDECHKITIPVIPKRIGVITSPTGAAVRDIINVTGRRFPGAEVYIFPALVQGEGAEESLINALDYFDKSRLCDVIIIGRGGGSIEDLWAFNSEKLARRIYEATVPIISAVGHETDFTICDFVADLRAPTPSAAAELVVPDRRELLLRLDSYYDRLSSALQRTVNRARERLSLLEERTSEDNIINSFMAKKETVQKLSEKSLLLIRYKIDSAKEQLAINASKADALSPLSTLSRGYSLAERNSRVLKRVSDLNVGEDFSLIMYDGKVSATVREITKEK